MTAYYNEIDPFAAQWLRNLIAAGHIAPGEVDERSILDVSPDDLAGFAQCHFFAGIGVWSYALRRAGWPDSRPVWTGSCPCQPFSVAGVGSGFDDERHLWPFWFHLIEQRRPPVVFGEQVEAAIRHGWLDLVQTDMEGIGYAFAAAGIPAAGVGAPHIRQRLWFVADAHNERRPGQHALLRPEEAGRHAGGVLEAAGRGELGKLAHTDSEQYYRGRNIGTRGGNEHPVGSAACGLDNPNDEGLEGFWGRHQATGGWFGEVRPASDAGKSSRLEHASSIGRNGRETTAPGHHDDRAASERAKSEHGFGIAGAHRVHQHGTGPVNGFWRNADWLLCRDEKWRPVEPGTFPLAHGATARVGRLRAYGNAIVAQVASEMIAAYLECRP